MKKLLTAQEARQLTDYFDPVVVDRLIAEVLQMIEYEATCHNNCLKLKGEFWTKSTSALRYAYRKLQDLGYKVDLYLNYSGNFPAYTYISW